MRGSVIDVFFIPMLILITFLAMLTVFTLYVKSSNFLETTLPNQGVFEWTDVNGELHQFNAPQMQRDAVKVWDYFLVALMLGFYGAFIFALSRIPVMKESLPAWILVGLVSFYFVYVVHSGLMDDIQGLSAKNNDLALALTYLPLTNAVVQNLPTLHLVFWVIGTIVFYAKERMGISISRGGGLSW